MLIVFYRRICRGHQFPPNKLVVVAIFHIVLVEHLGYAYLQLLILGNIVINRILIFVANNGALVLVLFVVVGNKGNFAIVAIEYLVVDRLLCF